MNRIRSFIAASIMFIILIISVHAVTAGISLKAGDRDFGFWFSPYKDLSYAALSENIGDNTVLVMGSSEFRHGRNSKYHPRNMFNGGDPDIMTIGGPCNQILFHTIALGSLEKHIKNRKVILLVSPTWFKKNGVRDVDYSIRFSESEYIKFLENGNIDAETRKYVAKRNTKLLRDNSKLRGKVKLINKKLISGKRDILTDLFYKMERFTTMDSDRVTAAVSIKSIKTKKKDPAQTEPVTQETFDKLAKQAEKESVGKSNNPFGMSDYSWKRGFKKQSLNREGAFPNRICEDSPEFDDLTAFLKVCRDTGIDAKLIILPVNGKWFDYIGTPRSERRKTADRIIKLAKEYGADVSDLTGHEYDSYITKDVTHPWNKGWVFINREIYDFCKS